MSAALSAALTGCKTTRPGAAPTGAQEHVMLLSPVTPASKPLEVNDLKLFDSGELRYVEVDEQGRPGKSFEHQLQSTNRFGAELSHSQGGGERIEYLKRDDDGNIVLTAALERRDDALTFFDPPLIVFWSRMTPEHEFASQSQMRIVDADDPDKQRASGRAKRTLVYRGQQRVRTPAGEFAAHRVDINFHVKLTLASASERSTLWIVPEIGIVAQQTDERVKAVMVMSRSKQRTLVLAELPR